MKRTPRSYRAAAEAVDAPSGELAEALGLPRSGRGSPRLVIGRREWIALPDLGISPLNAKTDSGARSSSVHAIDVQLAADQRTVRFTTVNHYNEPVTCEAAVAGTRRVRSSSGVARKRIFIETTALVPGGLRWKILLSLADRTVMRCPLLLGRRALAGRFLVDPQASHLLGPLRELERFLE